MTYSAGLDVSLEETAICVVDATGMIVKEMRAESAPGALDDALVRLDLPLERVGMEACSLAAWLHDGLIAAGWPSICIETRRANAAMKTIPNKTDRNDARALAQIMRTGWFRQVHVKSRQSRRWRSLLVARRAVLNQMRSIENVARAISREGGIKLGTPSRKDFAPRVREMAGNEPELMAMVEPLLVVLATMLEQLARLTRQVLDIVREEKACRLLMTSPLRGLLTASLPGIGSKASWPSMASVRSPVGLRGPHGPARALTYRATIDRPDRFDRSRDVGAHLGLTPRRYQSGETDITGKISRCGDGLARTALYEAAHSLLVRSRKWSALRVWGMAVAKRRDMAKAKVAPCGAAGSLQPRRVARKLAVILHSMWIDGTNFHFGKAAVA